MGAQVLMADLNVVDVLGAFRIPGRMPVRWNMVIDLFDPFPQIGQAVVWASVRGVVALLPSGPVVWMGFVFYFVCVVFCWYECRDGLRYTDRTKR